MRRPYGDWHLRWLAGFCWGACIAVCIGMFWGGCLHFVLQFFNCVYCIRNTPRTRMAGGLPDFSRPAVFLSARFVCEVFDDFFGADGHPLRAVSRVSSSGKSAGRTRPLSPTTGDAPTAEASGASLILPHKTGTHALHAHETTVWRMLWKHLMAICLRPPFRAVVSSLRVAMPNALSRFMKSVETVKPAERDCKTGVA